uniref:Uncharacterized protein n=1 Tax=Rhizophora mucronata TaxID=61149 RepID=A0A2P2ITP6_RHIMU
MKIHIQTASKNRTKHNIRGFWISITDEGWTLDQLRVLRDCLFIVT